MLSATPFRGDGRYYTDLAREDYYTKGGEPRGRWFGGATAHFELTGKRVGNKQLRNVLAGYDPRLKEVTGDSKGLVLNAGKESRQSGWDFTFSPSKSVSVLWALADEETRRVIQKENLEAAKEALRYLEENAAFTRRGKGGHEVEPAKLLVAIFEHSTSRLQDPLLHLHALISNVALRADGTTGTLYSHVTRDPDGKVLETYNPLMRHAKAAGALYRAELAYRLEKKLGLQIEKAENGWAFELAHIPKDVCEYYSKRRKEIEEHLAEVGFESAEAAEIANLATRVTKDDISRPELFGKWKEELEGFGLNQEFAARLLGQEIKREQAVSLDQAIDEASKALSEQRGSFTIKELHEALANQVVAEAVPTKDILARVEKEVTEGELVSLGTYRRERVLTTQENLRFEARFLDSLKASRENNRHEAWQGLVDELLEERAKRGEFQLSDEQDQALRYLVSGEKNEERIGGLRVLTGDAGTGKTAVLKEARVGWERLGYSVKGAALAGRAADNLEQSTRLAEAGIESNTIEKWNYELAKKKPQKGFRFDEKTVLVIDEAAMADSDKLYQLHVAAQEAGALVCWVGDEKQCQAIGHGGAFVQASRMVESVRLTENFRQQDNPIDKEASRLQSEGKSDEALLTLAKNGRVHVQATENQAIGRLVRDWADSGGTRSPTSHQVYCSTHQQRLALNEQLQAERVGVTQRTLGACVTNHEKQKLYAGDRVNFRETVTFIQRDRSLVRQALDGVGLAATKPTREKITTGSFGTIVSINPLADSVRVSMDDGRLLDVPLYKTSEQKRKLFPTPDAFKKKEKVEIALGYATTTHAGQGGTFDNVYSLMGGGMQNRELTYVQLTRARHRTQLYTSREVAGEELTLYSRLSDAERDGDEPRADEIRASLKGIEDVPEKRVSSSRLASQMKRSEQKRFALTTMDDLEKQRLEEQSLEHGVGG